MILLWSRPTPSQLLFLFGIQAKLSSPGLSSADLTEAVDWAAVLSSQLGGMHVGLPSDKA